MLNYVRVHIDKKLFSVSEPEAVMKRADDVLYHMDPKKPEDEELGFNTEDMVQNHLFQILSILAMEPLDMRIVTKSLAI